MKINYCPNCGISIHGQTRFCSKCGFNLSELINIQRGSKSGDDLKSDLKKFIENFIENNSDLLKELSARVEKGESFEKGMFFAVEMHGDTPIIKSGEIKDLKKIFKDTSIYPSFHEMVSKNSVIEFTEVKSEITDLEDGKRIILRLPGLSSRKDITINTLNKGIEIIGKGKEKIYFSKIPLDGEVEIKNSNLECEVLTIDITSTFPSAR
jgi:HSP20 family molecular chaperone IbpA